MSDRRSTETALQESWVANAGAWTRVVRAGSIASRRLATDAAIVEAVAGRAPRPARVLDLGCGEGWLARALAVRGIEVTGVDASPPLIDAARQAAADGGGGRSTFVVLGYEEMAADPAKAGTGYGAAVANFSLLGEDLTPMLRAARHSLAPHGGGSDGGGGESGVLIVQTVHPTACGAPYRDGWRTEDFRGFGESERGGDGGGIWRPMPWFFRTIGSWLALLREAGYAIEEMREPLHPETGLPVSLLIVGKPCGRSAHTVAGRFGEDAAG